MKKVKKIILSVIIILLILFLGIRIYHYSILSKISKTTENLESSFEPYFIKVTQINADGSCNIDENYRENNVAVSIYTTQKDGEVTGTSKSWSFLEESFCNEYHASYIEDESTLMCAIQNEDRIKEEFNTVFINYWSYKFPNLRFETDLTFFDKVRINLQSTILYPAVKTEEYKGESYYAFYPFGSDSHMRMYVDKETYLPVAIKSWGQDKSELYIREFEYLKEAPDGVYEKPNPEDFDNVTFADYSNNSIDINSKIKLVAEKPISRTNLKTGEMLIENVDIKSDEDLNFLKLTPNESGIIDFEIYNLETYNKFREKYSGLRELTEEDFEEYYVAITYKEGNKLKHLQSVSSTKNNKVNYIFDTEKSNKESLVLIVTPLTDDSSSSIFIKNKEKFNISEDDAIKTVSENIKELNPELVLDVDNYVNVESSQIVKLDNETFAGLDVIKTPVKGKEPMCWKLTVVDGENKRLDAYVDIMTGSLIGSSNRDV